MANQYVNKFVKDGVTKFDLTGDTVTPETLAEGVTAHDASGAEIVGTAELVPTIQLGLRADFVNKTFIRLGNAVGLNSGSDFDKFPMYNRRRCNLADDGTVNAYLGDYSYKSDGSNGQVMVEQPKFYYKVVPLTLNVNDDKQLDVAEYWISNKHLPGYKLHPAFYNVNGREIDCFYEGAYEGYVTDSKLNSISGVTPSGNLTISQFRNYATNRGIGWFQETIWSVSADQLLMLIEYGKFNMQESIGKGNVNNKNYNSIDTGALNVYGNYSYGSFTDSDKAVQWRGKENPWGNFWKFMDGIIFRKKYDTGATYIANNYNFADDTDVGYTQLGYKITQSYGYIGRFGYDENFDWIFIPYGDIKGDSALPVGDYGNLGSGAYLDEWNVARVSGVLWQDVNCGAFYISSTDGASHSANKYNTSRLLYVG